jgi:excisionase family DNA binding protein
MAQGYYTLQEAAQVLGISLDELKQMAQKSRIRSFQDRGNLRFRTQDIQELARQRGATSDPELVLGEASLPAKKGDSPRPPKSPVSKSAGPKTPPREDVPEVFDFDMDDGGSTDPSSASKKASKSSAPPKSGTSPRSGIQPRSAPVLQSKVVQPSSAQPRSGDQPRSGATQVQKPGSDSDVRLVTGSSEVMLTLAPDSDIKLRDKDSGSKAPGRSSKLGGKSGTPPTSDPTGKRASKLGGPRSPQPPDSGVRLVPMDSDSDVRIVSDEVPLGGSPAAAVGDSNVRLEKVAFPSVPVDVSAMMTDEINLDEELRKEEERLEKEKPKRPSKVKPKSELKFPTTSPFELSDSDVDDARQSAGGLKDDSSDFDMTPVKDDSSNFDLPLPTDSSSEIPALKDDSSGNFKLTPDRADDGSSNDDFSLELDDGEPHLGGGELKAPASGISLSNPIDAGISLEKQASDDSLEFDLSLEPESTPKPAQMKQLESDDEGSSEFELSLELGDEEGGKPAKAADDSDSEFELTLDDSGDLSLEPEGTPQVKAGGDDAEAQDIFESDFDIPALQEDGAEGSATVDTELESSDFDIALDDSELAADEESGSQVVALDEEEIEAAGDDEVEINIEEDGEFGDLEVEGDADEEYDTRPTREVVRDRILRPAPWGPMPTIVMLPCVVIMLLVGLVGFEMVQSSVAHRPPGFMTRTLNDGLVGIGLSKKMP